MAAKTFNVGVVGYGLSAKVFHIPFIGETPRLKLHSIVQRTPKEGDSAPNDYPDIKHFTDYKDLLADPEVDLVVLGTPPSLHFDQTKAALEAKKHVLTEKPFVPSSAQADKLISIARENQRLLFVYQNRRWDNDFLTVQRLVSEGTLGRLAEFHTHFDRYSPSARASWKASLKLAEGGSSIFDLGTHLLDQVYILFGMPTSVHGRLLNQRTGAEDLECPDSIQIDLKYPQGLLVHVRNSVMSIELEQPRFWMRGTKGSFRKVGLDTQEDQLKGGMKTTNPEFGKEPAASYRLTVLGADGKPKEEKAPVDDPLTYKAFYAGLAKALETGKEEDVPVKATEARDVLRIIEAAVESAKTQRDVSI